LIYKQNFPGIIFDMDGVLINSEPLHIQSWKLVLKKYGFNFADSWFDKWIGVPDNQICNEIIQEYCLNSDVNELLSKKQFHFRDIRERESLLFPGIMEALRLIKKFPKAIVTSSSKDDAYYIVEKENLYDFFRVIITSDDVSNCKPDPEPYLIAAQKLKIPPNNCIALEDSYSGIKSAKAANMTVYGIMTTLTAAQMFNADQTFHSTVGAIDYLYNSLSNK